MNLERMLIITGKKKRFQSYIFILSDSLQSFLKGKFENGHLPVHCPLFELEPLSEFAEDWNSKKRRRDTPTVKSFIATKATLGNPIPHPRSVQLQVQEIKLTGGLNLSLCGYSMPAPILPQTSKYPTVLQLGPTVAWLLQIPDTSPNKEITKEVWPTDVRTASRKLLQNFRSTFLITLEYPWMKVYKSSKTRYPDNAIRISYIWFFSPLLKKKKQKQD